MNTNNKGHAANVALYNSFIDDLDYSGDAGNDHAFAPGIAESEFGSIGCQLAAPESQSSEDKNTRTAHEAWPKPMPLPKLPAVPEFPLELLPDDLIGWVSDAAERARFRPDFAAVASMVALGAVLGRKLGIRLKQRDDWTEYANVWGGLIGLLICV